MVTITRFEDFDVFKKAMELTNAVYAVSGLGSFARDFALRDQIRRAAISMVSNFGEGFERDGKAEFIQFLSIAKGSVGEIKAQLYVALDQKYITSHDFDRLYSLTEQTSKMIAGLMTYLRNAEMKGIKFKKSETRN